MARCARVNAFYVLSSRLSETPQTAPIRHYYCVTTPPSPGTDPNAEPQTSPPVPAQPAPPGVPPYPAPPQAYPPPGYPLPYPTPPQAYPRPPGYPPPLGHPPYPAQPYQPPPGFPPPPGFQAPAGYQYLPPPTSPAGFPLADFGQRLLARVIDGAILGGISAVVLIPLYIYVLFVVIDPTVTVNGEIDDPAEVFLPLLAFIAFVLVFSLALTYVYEVEMMFRSGQTFGKRIMKIRIIPVDPAQTLTRGHAARRFLVNQGAGLVPGLGWVDGLFQLWDKPYRQCLHDKFAKTLVIKLGA
jgi:uncharacterized RDD family membrane protein YckC